MADTYIDYAYEETPSYEKRRRPERCSVVASVRRGTMRAQRRSGSSFSPFPGARSGGFHRRMIKKPFYGM
ncbi:MAG TPA: hypothetical protein VF175_03670 [Lacipirellula sp.]